MTGQFRTLAIAGMLLAGSAVPSAAADVDFNGAVSTSCTINVTRNGLLRQSADARRLLSQGSGGRVGRASVRTTGYGYDLTVEAPTAFDTEPSEDAGSPEIFTAQMRSGGATSFSWATGSRTLNIGNSNVSIRLTVRKPTRTSFANGD